MFYAMISRRNATRLLAFGLLVGGLVLRTPAEAARARSRAPAAPVRAAAPAARPAPIVALTVSPANAVLDGPKARQQLLVTGVRQDGTVADLTASARYVSRTPQVAAVSPEGVVRPVGDGVAVIAVQAGGKSAQVTLRAKNTKAPFVWNFENHVISVLSKAGCNMGACHGAAAGKGGFRLTLRGYDPELDYERLLREAGGRRIQRADPGNSLILKKATLAIPHGGGMRFKPGSLEYRVVADWIAAGMPGPSEKDPRLVRLEVLPRERTLDMNASQQLVVLAHFSDGHVEDVTHWARYSSNEEAVATVDEGGRITVKGVGETAVQVWYLGQVTFARVAVPFPNRITARDLQSVPRVNYIDDLVLKKLAKLRIPPSELASDEEFLRRVYLDTIGTLPTPAEVRAFLASKDPQKRARLIDDLLERPEFVDFWTYKWGDLLRINRETLTEKGMWAFYTWLRDSVAENKPWDQLVREIITANGSNFSYGPSNFYRISRTPNELTETVSQAFLGIRVQCAQCHNHPFEKWTQADYYRFANLFARVNRKQGDHPADFIITAAASGEVNFPKTGKPLPPAPYDAPPAPDGMDRRVYLAEWLTSPKNTYFVQSIVNRIWRHYMGRGLIEPVDDLRATNPPANEELMQALCRDLVEHRFDLKHLMRRILNSRTYQLTSRPAPCRNPKHLRTTDGGRGKNCDCPSNEKDDRQYSRYFVRRLTAEQLLDAICQVTGQPEKFQSLPAGTRAIQLPDTRVNNYFLDVFGRPPRQITCECERAQEPNMAQALHLINGASVNQKISSDNGLVATLLKAGKKDPEIVEELYLACLSRFPTRQEMQTALQAIDEAMNPKPEAPAAPPAAKPAAPAKGKAAAKPPAAAPKPAEPQAQPPVDPKAQPAAAKPEAKPEEKPKPDPAVARRQVLEDLLWALINGKEFVFNH